MPWYNVEVIGDIGVGKSSLVRRFFLGEFNEAYHGGSQSKKREKASLPCVDNYERHGLIIWDGDRQPVKYPPRGLGLWWDHELPITAAVVVVYDITKPSSFNEAKRHVEKYCSDWRLLESFPVVGLVGSKADLWKRRKIKYEDAQHFAQENHILFMEVSAFTGMNVHNLFSKIGLMVQSRDLWEFSAPQVMCKLVDELDMLEKRKALPRVAKVQEIDLSYLGMKIPDTDLSLLRSFHSLCKLDLSHSELYKLPEAFGYLRSLTHLFLNDNYLSSLQPNIIGQLVKLQELDLRNNILNDFSLDITELSYLQRLSVQGNPLRNDEARKLMMLANNGRWIDIAVSIPELKRRTITRIMEQEAEVPKEILFKGQRTMQMYQKALRDGFVNVFRGRIFLIGQDRAGKTSLKKSLLGVPFDPKEESTEGIDPSKCDIDVNRVQNWRFDSKNTILSEVSEQISRSLALELFPSEASEQISTSLEVEHFPSSPRPRIARDGSALRLNGASSSQGSRKEEMIASNVFSVKLEKVNETEHCSKEAIVHSSTRQVKRGGSLVTGDDDDDDQTTVTVPGEVAKYTTEYLKQLFLQGQQTVHDNITEDPIVTLELWDFAGQHLYYASHPVFFSPRGVYVLVHNLSKPLDALAEPCVRQGLHDIFLENPNGETNMENLLSWLVTVHGSRPIGGECVGNTEREDLAYLRPPVIIVGTHADKPVEDINVITSQIQRGISGKEYEKHVIRPFFNVDNTKGNESLLRRMMRFLEQRLTKGQQAGKEGDSVSTKSDGIDALRAKIMEVLRQEPYVGEKIPTRWAHFERVLEELVAQKIHYKTVEQLQTSARDDCLIDDDDEFQTMLNFYHDLGLIIKHRSTVVLEAKWLIDLFKGLITIPRFDKANPLCSTYWQEVEKSGVLCMELVNHVFSKFVDQTIVKEDILNMMDQFGLIAKFTSTTSGTTYFVPAQLKTPPTEICKLHPTPADPCPLYLHFSGGFVPKGLFLRLVSSSISWCCKTWQQTPPPTLYQNGAHFVIVGEQIIYDFILLCQKSFIKIVLRQKDKDEESDSGPESMEIPSRVRVFIDDTLQKLSHELPCLGGLQYELSVACPNCRAECPKHREVACTQEECTHLLKLKEGQRLVCTKIAGNSVRRVAGIEKWLSLRRTQMQCTHILQDRVGESDPEKSVKALNVTLLASEWGSSMGGLSTINRNLAILLAKHSLLNITLLVPQSSCSEEDRRDAAKRNIVIREAESLPGFDPLDCLSFPPKNLAVDIVLGHGAKLGKQAQVIRKSHSCKWVQVVHTAPEELGMFKNYHSAVAKGEEKNRAEVDLCRLADLVVAVGPKLRQAYSSYLRVCKKHQYIFQLTPGTFHEFSMLEQATLEEGKFKVLTFGRGDSEDFSLKGYDIAAKAVAELKDSSYCLVFVGAPTGKQDEVAQNLLQTGIAKDQLIVRAFVQSKERLKELFCEVDLAIMPSRTEGFGLTALEALSAGLPILVSGNSGFAHALRDLTSGKSFVVNSNDPKEWAKAIAAVRQKRRAQRLREIQTLRASYEERYNWEEQCGALVEKMWNMVQEK